MSVSVAQTVIDQITAHRDGALSSAATQRQAATDAEAAADKFDRDAEDYAAILADLTADAA